MSRLTIGFVLFSILMLAEQLHAQEHEPEDTTALMNQIRHDRFDEIIARPAAVPGLDLAALALEVESHGQRQGGAA